MASSYQDTVPPNPFHLLSSSTEELGLHDDRLFGELSLPLNLVVAWLSHVRDRSSSSLVSGSKFPHVCSLMEVCSLSRWTDGQKLWSPFKCSCLYQGFPSDLGDICQSWSRNDACPQHYPGLLWLLMLADAAVAQVALKCPGRPQSGWHVGSLDKRAVFCFFIRSAQISKQIYKN